MPIIGPLTGPAGVIQVTGVNGDLFVGPGGPVTLVGDAIGPVGSDIVVSISGETGTVNVGTAANIITWNAGTTGPTLAQATATSAAWTPQGMTISSQAPYASAAGTNRVPGNLILATPNVVGGYTGLGHVIVQSDGYTIVTYGNAGIQLGTATCTISTGSVFTGIQALTPDQYCRPRIVLAGNVPISMVLQFPAIDGATWIVTTASGVYGVSNQHLLRFQANGITGTTFVVNSQNTYMLVYSSAIGRLLGIQYAL